MTRPAAEKRIRTVVPRSMGRFTIFFAREIWRQKKWLLAPVWLLLAAMALLIIFGGGSALLPAIYIAF